MNKESRKSILEMLDYSLSTRTLSEQSGIENRHNTEYRKQHSKGRATVYSPHQKPRKMRIDPKSIDWSKSVAELAVEAGVSKQRLYQMRRRVVDAMVAEDAAASAAFAAEGACCGAGCC